MQNGVPTGVLMPTVAGSSGARLRFGSASRWAAIRNEVHARFGWWPEVTSAGDGFRDLARQRTLFLRNYTTTNTGHGPRKLYEGSWWWRKTAGTPSAATPGTSNHGYGTTVDVVGLGGLNDFTTTRYRQFAEVAARHGFSNAEGRRIGEPWHWSDTLDPDVASGITPPTTEEPEMSLTDEQNGVLHEIHAMLAAGGAIGIPLARTMPGRTDVILDEVRGLPAALAQIVANVNGLPDALATIHGYAKTAAEKPAATVDAAALARLLEPAIAQALGQLGAVTVTDASVEQIAEAVADQLSTRLAQ